MYPLLPSSSPAESPEPGQVVGMVNSVADVDDFLETLDLDAHDLHRMKRHREEACFE